MQITYYGHSCCGVNVAGKNVLFDPFITGNELAANIDVDKLPADLVILTHGHMDHVLDAERILKRTGAKLVSNFEICTWYGLRDVVNYHAMNTGGTWSFDEHIRIRCVPALHSSSLPDNCDGGDPNGYVLSTPEGNFYHAGDTGLSLEMQLLERHELKFAFLPIGDNYTMGYDDAVIAAEFIGCDRIIGIHYDSFPPIRIDHAAAKRSFKDAGKELILMQVGETIEI